MRYLDPEENIDQALTAFDDTPKDIAKFPEPDEEKVLRGKNLKEKRKDEEAQANSLPLLVKQGIVADEVRAKFLSQKTPKYAIYERPAKGGGKWKYVTGDYVIRSLNIVFGFQWNFEILPVKEGEMFYMGSKQVIVYGKLTVLDTEGKARIVKSGVGRKDIIYPKGGTTPLDLGNDLKAAETDALKRCARQLGIGLDLYTKE